MRKAQTPIRIAELCEKFSLTNTTDGTSPETVVGLCGLTDDLPDHLSFITDEGKVAAAAASRIAAFVVPVGVAVPGKCTLASADPEMAMAALAELFAREPMQQDVAVHESAIIGDNVTLGAGVMIGPRAVIGSDVALGDRTRIYAGVVIGDGVEMGEDCTVHANAVVREDCRLGNRVVLQPGCSIGGDGYGFVTRKGRHHKIPQIGHVILEDDVEVGANSTIDRGRFSATVVRRGTKIDNLVMIGHNCQIGEDCLIVSQVGISGSTRLGNRVVLAGQVGVAGHIELVDDVVALGMTMVSNSIRKPGVYAGHPARPVALWRRAVALYWQNARRSTRGSRGEGD